MDLLGLGLAAAVIATAPVAVGTYTAVGPDVASRLELSADHHFRYARSEGALDESAVGIWAQLGAVVLLTTNPPPRPARLVPSSAYLTGEYRLKIAVDVGDGGLAGVHLRVGFDHGDPAIGYTQEDGWILPASEARVPQWVELSIPMFDFGPVRFPIYAKEANAITFTLEPNDIQIRNFRATPATLTGGGLTIELGDELIRYRRRP